jgi:hypothetical protein
LVWDQVMNRDSSSASEVQRPLLIRDVDYSRAHSAHDVFSQALEYKSFPVPDPANDYRFISFDCSPMGTIVQRCCHQAAEWAPDPPADFTEGPKSLLLRIVARR